VSSTVRFDPPSFVEHLYNLPLAESFADPVLLPSPQLRGKIHFVRDLPPYMRKILHACLPGSVYVEDEESEAEEEDVREEEDTGKTSASTSDTCEITGLGLCPSPKHQQSGTPRLFVRHAEERFTWETMIAGVPVSGLVPARWRGCQWACLDFLDQPDDNKQPAMEVSHVNMSDHGIDVDDGEDIEGVVQPIQLTASQAGGLADFDE